MAAYEDAQRLSNAPYRLGWLIRPLWSPQCLPTPAAGYDQLAERRFEFITLWGFLVFLLYTMRRINRRRCGVVVVEEVPWGDGKRTLTRAYMLFLARWARDFF